MQSSNSDSLSLGVAEPRQEDGNPQKRGNTPEGPPAAVRSAHDGAPDEINGASLKKKRKIDEFLRLNWNRKMSKSPTVVAFLMKKMGETRKKKREAEQKTREAEQKTRGVEEKLHQIEEAAISLNEVLPSCDTNTGSSATEIMKHARVSFVQKEETEKDLKSQNEELQCQLLSINGPGPSRLVNSGASCYLNSAMQALASVPSVGKELRSLTKDPISGDGPRLHMLIKLINRINNHTSDGNRRETFTLEVTTVFNDWCKPGQQDAFELLSYVLNQVYDERRRLKKQTIAEFLAEDLPLRLRMRYQLRCGTQGCKALSFTPPQVSLAIHVPVPAQSFSNRFSKPKLQAVVGEAFLTEQRLSVDECCEQCRKPCHVLKSRRLVGRVPEVLCLQLQRAQNSASVQLEESLQLTRRDFFESSEEPQQPVDVMHYRLVAVIVHHGFSTMQGHYTCYRRYGPNRWFLANDSSVTECKLSEVLSCEPYVVLMVRGSERQ